MGGAHRVEHGARLADADEVRMDPRRAEAGIVGGDHHIALRQHVGQPPDHTAIVGHESGGAGLHHAAGRMGPSDHLAPARRRRAGREMDGARDLDGLPVEPGRAIEDAEGLAVGWSAADEWPDPDDRAGPLGCIRDANETAKRNSGADRKP